MNNPTTLVGTNWITKNLKQWVGNTKLKNKKIKYEKVSNPKLSVVAHQQNSNQVSIYLSLSIIY